MTSYANRVDDLFSQPYSNFYTQVVSGEEVYVGDKPPPPPPPRRGRRKKSKEDSAGGMEVKKRRLSAVQVDFLEMNFGNEYKLETERKDKLALELGLDPRQVAVWFQNRRVRWKTKKLEEEYSELKNAHQGVLVDKCRLHAEVLKLKDKLSEAEKEIQKLLGRLERASSGLPFSMDANQTFLGEFGVEGLENFFYSPDNSYIHGMEWMNLFG